MHVPGWPDPHLAELPATPWADLGCGRRKQPGAIGVDSVALTGVDVVARLEALPFRPGSLAGAHAHHVLEHVDDLASVMGQIHASLRPGGRLVASVPYFSSAGAYADPTHRRWFTYTTFEHFTAPTESGWQANRHTWFTGLHFRVLGRHLEFGRLHRLTGVEWLANRLPAVYENFLAHVAPARVLYAILGKPDTA